MKNRIPTFDEFVNEGLFQEQIPYVLNTKLHPGDVLVAAEDFSPDDIDFAKMSKSKIGRISKLNVQNWYKTDDSFGSPEESRKNFFTKKKGELIGVVLSNKDITNSGFFSLNIDDPSSMEHALNILYTEGKISVEKYNKNNNEQRIQVFNANLRGISWYNKNKYVIDLGRGIEFEPIQPNYSYTRKQDELIITNGFDTKTGQGVPKQLIKNASKDDKLVVDGRPLNEV